MFEINPFLWKQNSKEVWINFKFSWEQNTNPSSLNIEALLLYSSGQYYSKIYIQLAYWNKNMTVLKKNMILQKRNTLNIMNNNKHIFYIPRYVYWNSFSQSFFSNFQKKCQRYWPLAEENEMLMGTFSIQLFSEKTYANFEVHHLKVTNKKVIWW